MKVRIFKICFIFLIVGVCITFSNALTFNCNETAKAKIAQANEMDYRFSEAQEEEMKGEEEDWYVLPDEGQGEDENEIYVPPTEPEGDYFKYAPSESDSEEDDEHFQDSFESEKDHENDPLEDEESRR
jgi:hypothetical protein